MLFERYLLGKIGWVDSSVFARKRPIKLGSTVIELDFVDAVHTLTPLMVFANELHLAGSSLSNTVPAL
jgi:hypothetical protein